MFGCVPLVLSYQVSVITNNIISFAMKVVKKKTDQKRVVTLRLPEMIMQRIDKFVEKNRLSRQALVAAILKQVVNDKGFVLKVCDAL